MACAPSQDRSAWASAQSDQSSQCAQQVAKDPRFLQADSKGPVWSESSQCAQRVAKDPRFLHADSKGPVWSDSSQCAQRVAKDQRFLHADSKDFDQTGQNAQAELSLPWAHSQLAGFVIRQLISFLQKHVMIL